MLYSIIWYVMLPPKQLEVLPEMQPEMQLDLLSLSKRLSACHNSIGPWLGVIVKTLCCGLWHSARLVDAGMGSVYGAW